MKKLLGKNIKLTILIISLLVIIVASTYALYVTNLANTNINSNVKTLGIQYSKGTDILNGTLNPSSEKSDAMSMSITLWKNIPETVYGEISINVKEIGTGLSKNFLKWEIWNGSTKLNEGNFDGKVTGNKFQIHTEELTTSSKTFKVYVWLDEELLDDFTIGDQVLKLTVTAKANQLEYEQTLPTWDGTTNRPNLVDGMIPIKYDGTNWVKANIKNSSNEWYDYNNKKWANAVMVTSGTRDKYMADPVNTVIQEADILAYFVWIPRYKYQLFNSAFAAITQKEIQIQFEQNTSTTGTVSCSTSNLGVETCSNKTDGNWYTHPAFTFGADELTGIWVGKFETTGDATTPTVKPNLMSLRNQNLSTQFATSQKFGSITYVTSTGTTKIDSHMMKNIEWGAVAYLTGSKYGRCTSGTCTEVTINNSSGFYTGRAGSTPSDTAISANGTYTYETTNGQLASTTGNIYGIYDLSGGAYEYTFGVLVDATGQLYSGNSATNNSGFTGTYGTSGLIYTGTPFPDSKYYDKYAYGTSSGDLTRSHLGDATGETRSWNSDAAGFIFAPFPWFGRGGSSYDGTLAGPFCSSSLNGNAGGGYSFRPVVQSK